MGKRLKTREALVGRGDDTEEAWLARVSAVKETLNKEAGAKAREAAQNDEIKQPRRDVGDPMSRIYFVKDEDTGRVIKATARAFLPTSGTGRRLLASKTVLKRNDTELLTRDAVDVKSKMEAIIEEKGSFDAGLLKIPGERNAGEEEQDARGG